MELGFKIQMALRHGMAMKHGEIHIQLMNHFLWIFWKVEFLVENGEECQGSCDCLIYFGHGVYCEIVPETNRYATAINEDGSTHGGKHWQELTVARLKAYFAIILYIGMKKQPNLKSYWVGSTSFFHCLTISKIMSRRQFLLLNKCLHLRNLETYMRNKNLPEYDKMGQVRHILNVVRSNFIRV